MKTVCNGVDEQEMPRKVNNTSNINGLRKRSKRREILRVENLDADHAASGLCSRITVPVAVNALDAKKLFDGRAWRVLRQSA